ncbi:MAG: hypothetical protein COS99_02580 [Candidatus Omnitrophica bacterium CG07_land_8_20_14_0_80_42_15]|uniref:Uncharacterized protein n=1 Tax=Candidatus Aquitaenariimonas noxiae TaxID=1974741 RepID=A0A2J0L3X9_9BACT|nr:MAG: hypothetical protein COS99_02580 [Candidatus Omnitrophica bacterium CG07_land_8_20_14_0_80_42_15]
MIDFKKIFTFGKDDRYQKGINYYNNCEYEKAVKEFEDMLADTQYAESLHSRLAEFYTSQCYRNMGIIAMHETKFQDAIRYFEKSLKILPQSIMLSNYLGICYNNIGLYDQAIAEFEKVLTEKKDDITLNVRIALAYYNKGDHHNAVKRLQGAIVFKPKHADLHHILGLVYCNINDYKAGIDEFNKSIDINPVYVEALRKLGLAYIIIEKYDEAKGLLQRLTRVVPHDVFSHYCLALTYNILGDPTAALAEFENATSLGLKTESKELESKENSRRILLEIAREEFSKAIMINATFTSILTPLESEAKDIGLYNTLIRIYKSILDEHPTYADFHHKLGQVYDNLHMQEEAIAEFAKASEINPDYLHARISLAFSYKEMGHIDKAIEEFQFILSKQSDLPVIYFQLALLYKEKKDKAKAIELLNKALDLKPDLEEARDLIKELRG